MNHYLWWIPATIVYYTGFAYLSKLNNESTSKMMLLTIFLYGALCPLWVIISRLSKNVMVDGAMYDVILGLTYIITMHFLGASQGFTWYHWLGIVMIFMGFCITKVP